MARDGLDAETIAMSRSDDQRERLRLQEELLDLPLGARWRLGRAFALTHEKVAASTRGHETVFCPITDIKNDFVYVVLSTRGVARNDVMKRTLTALVAARLPTAPCHAVWQSQTATGRALSSPTATPTEWLQSYETMPARRVLTFSRVFGSRHSMSVRCRATRSRRPQRQSHWLVRADGQASSGAVGGAEHLEIVRGSPLSSSRPAGAQSTAHVG